MPDFLQRITSDTIEGNAVGIGQLSVPMDGSPGQVLATNGNGVLMWVDQTAGSGTGSGSGSGVTGCDDPNTVLLIHSDTMNASTIFNDSSQNTKTVTAVGEDNNVQHSTAQSKFGGSSIAFDGSGDELQISHHSDFDFGSSDFTVEYWIRTNGSGNSFAWALCHKGVPGDGQNTGTSGMNWWLGNNGSQLSINVFTSGGTVNLRGGPNLADQQWHHVAMVRNGNVWTSYADGVQADTQTLAGSIISAATTTTDFLIDFETDGTTNSSGWTASLAGSAARSTADSQYGTGSLLTAGSSSWLKIDPEAGTVFNNNSYSGDFTVEFWHKKTSIGGFYPCMFLKGPNNANDYDIRLYTNSGDSIIYADASFSGGGIQINGGSPGTTTNWQHYAIVRDGDLLRLYVNGVELGNSACSGTINNVYNSFYIGAGYVGTGVGVTYHGGYYDNFSISSTCRYPNGTTFTPAQATVNYTTTNDFIFGKFIHQGSGDFNGHMDEIRMSNVARYTSNFTPSTTAFCQDVSSTSFTFQGTDSGYTIGGHNLNFPGAATDLLDKFSFTSGNVASSVNGGLTSARHAQTAQKSATHGYATGGNSIASPGVSNRFDTIDKFPFASESVAVATHGTLAAARSYMAGGSSGTHGYVVAGTFGLENGGTTDTMEKFTVASDSDSVVITGVLSTNREQVSDSQSATHGYINGSVTAPSIQKYSFSSDADSVVYNGNLLLGRGYVAGQSSEIKGYVSGGTTNGSTTVTNIEQYSFASESNATDVGVLSLGRYGPAGTSSTTDGYNAGGFTGDGNTFSQTNNIDKFSFASNNNAIDHADLSQSRSLVPGTQF